jgi:hypothetical protein
MSSQLTEANLRQLSGPSREEQESALLEKMQTLSNLLGQVEAAIEDCPSTRPASSVPPGTGRSSRPPTGRGSTAASNVVDTGRAIHPPPPGTGNSTRSGRMLPSGDSAQLLVVNEEKAPAKQKPVEFVQYVGSQSNMPGGTGRRHIDARAASSSMGSVLFGGD